MSALLEVDELQVSFGGRTAAVRGASFRVEKGETHCLVGESGCGKSVTALAVMSLLARGGHRSAKRMSFAGTDLTSLSDHDDAGQPRRLHRAVAGERDLRARSEPGDRYVAEAGHEVADLRSARESRRPARSGCRRL